MDYKVCVVAPNEHISHTVHELVEELKHELQGKIIIVNGDMENGVRNAKSVIERGVDAIISRGGTAYLLSQVYTRVPVIAIQIDALDILKTVRRIGEDKHIGFISYSNVIYQYQAMAEVLGVNKIPYFQFVDYGEEYRIEQFVQEAKECGVDILIGGAHVQDYAKKYGISSVFLESGKDTVLKAIREAETAIIVRRKEQENLKIINDIVDHAYIGIVVFDKHCHVKKWNTTFLSMFPQLLQFGTENLEEQIRHIFVASQIKDVLKGKIPDMGEVLSIGNRTYALRWHTILDKYRITGATAFIQETEELQSYARSMRKKLQEKGLVARYTLDDIVGRSLAVRKVKREALKDAGTRSTVLITGESGTGKEMLAQAIHNLSDRRHGPFVAINCGAFTESLLESEIFGYEEGTFTGARKGGKAGVFELADGGTLFLDEIGDMPYVLQNRLLRVLQEKAVMRVGGSKVIPVDVRIIAATNQKLEQAVEEKKFRLDLFYRLDVLRIRMPALRERTGDIPLLSRVFLASLNQKYKTEKSFAPEVLRFLNSQEWPGNVRQLMNTIERMVLLSDGYTITLQNVQGVLDVVPDKEASEEHITLNKIRKLSKEGKTYSQIASILGISRSTLWRFRQKEKI